MANVVVVGGGFAGMSAAARLAKLRHQVTLLESGQQLGGRLNGITIDGRTWQTELDTVTLPGVFRDLFRKSGRPLERVLELTKTEGRRHVFKDKSVLDLPLGNRGDQHGAIVEAFGEDAWSPWIDTLAEPWDVIRRMALDQVFAGKPAVDRTVRKVLRPRRTIATLAEKDFDDDRLRKLVLDPVRLAGQDRQRHSGVRRRQPLRGAFVRPLAVRRRPARACGRTGDTARRTRRHDRARRVGARAHPRRRARTGCRDLAAHRAGRHRRVVCADVARSPAADPADAGHTGVEDVGRADRQMRRTCPTRSSCTPTRRSGCGPAATASGRSSTAAARTPCGRSYVSGSTCARTSISRSTSTPAISCGRGTPGGRGGAGPAPSSCPESHRRAAFISRERTPIRARRSRRSAWRPPRSAEAIGPAPR